MPSARRAALGALAAAAILLPLPGRAEEGGSGHYLPGGTASFVDALPTKDGFAVADFFSYYDASATSSRPLPVGGLVTAGLDATAYANTVLAIYRSPLKMLGGSYVLAVALPIVWLTVDGKVEGPGPLGGILTRSTHDSTSGLGDIAVYPLMIAWNAYGGDLRSDVRFGLYVPTGDYAKGRLANAGKNFWTFEPMVSMSYLSSKIGTEVSAYAGLDFNTKNQETEYRSGTQLHLDVTVAQHLPLLGGAIGVGANAFYYQQITGDSGDGAVLGDLKGRTIGVGPVVSYAAKPWGLPIALEAKWLPELEVENRLEGDIVWAKLGIQF